MDLEPLVDAAMKLGIFVVAAGALWYTVMVPRKGRSSLLVPGWLHDALKDDAKAELEAQRQFYTKALADEQERASVRIAEWRAFRDEAVAKAEDADDDRRRLLEAVTNQSRDIAVLLELSRMADRDSRVSGAARAE